MKKSELRKEALKARKSLDADTIGRLNTALLTQFATLDFTNVSVLHIFLPITEKAEPNTFLLIDWLKKSHPHIKVLVPKADFDTSLMSHHELTTSEDLEKSIFNILEPRTEKAYRGEIDMIVVPLLAFDLRGYRVGYGKGFYDRFLTGSTAIKIGLSFFEATETIVDADALDVRLDLCITPERIYQFNA